MTIFGVILFASFILTSCGGNSIESDAKKVAELQCKAQHTFSIVEAGGHLSVMEFKESTKLLSELGTLSKELERKYTSDSDKQKFDKALLIQRKAIHNCK